MKDKTKEEYMKVVAIVLNHAYNQVNHWVYTDQIDLFEHPIEDVCFIALASHREQRREMVNSN